MRKSILITLVCLLFVFLTGCSSQQTTSTSEPPKPVEKTTLTAADVLTGLKAAGLPIVNEVEYTAETDPNKKLGRPNQYTGKINFKDSRITLKSNDDFLGYIEVFSNEADMQTRANYIKEVSAQMSMVGNYVYTHKNTLLRVDFAATPAQAAEYEKALKTL